MEKCALRRLVMLLLSEDHEQGQWRNNGAGSVGKVQGPSSLGAPSSRQKLENNFPATVKIRTS